MTDKDCGGSRSVVKYARFRSADQPRRFFFTQSATHSIMICDNEVTPAVSTGSVPRILIGHALVHSCSFDEVVEAIVRDAAIGEEPKYVVTPNAQHVVLLENDKHLRQIFSQAAF